MQTNETLSIQSEPDAESRTDLLHSVEAQFETARGPDSPGDILRYIPGPRRSVTPHQRSSGGVQASTAGTRFGTQGLYGRVRPLVGMWNRLEEGGT